MIKKVSVFIRTECPLKSGLSVRNHRNTQQFSKKEIKHPNDYLFSALFANTLMRSKSPEQQPEALWYPSVAYKYKGFNVVFKTQLIDNSELILRRVFHYRLKFDNPDSYPKITRIKEAVRIDGNSIIW